MISQSICHEVIGPNAMMLVFWMLNFKPAFSLPYFTFMKRLFSSSLLSAIRGVSSAYLRLLIFLLTLLIPACDSSCLAFHMMYSAYKLNKQGDKRQPCHVPFPILNQSFVPCPVLLLLDLHRGFSGTGNVVWHSHLFKNFPPIVVWYNQEINKYYTMFFIV